MTKPSEREFVIRERGDVREELLRGWREGLRQAVDPTTQLPFDEDVIRRVTMRGSRFFVEADSVDLSGMAIQKRAEFFAQQVRIDRAATAFLNDVHGPEWGEAKLPATGGSGTVLAAGTAGTTFIGSTTIPDAFATRGTDQAGNEYQVFISDVVPAAGTVTLTLQAIDTGEATNLRPLTEGQPTLITWSNPPAGAQPTATVNSDFTGGTELETDEDFANRLLARIRHKPASANWAHFRAFARQSSNAVEDAFVYAAHAHAGSTLVAVTQKRSTAVGPTARIASLATLTSVTNFLTPPGSPVIPGRAHVVVTTVTGEDTDGGIRLGLRTNTAAGWDDAEPWPKNAGAPTSNITISTVTTQTNFKVLEATGSLPGGGAGPLTGTDAPQLMVWDETRSAFEALDVLSVEETGAGEFTILLNNAPTATLIVGQAVSPDTALRDIVGDSIVSFFDSLGPGEVLDLATDARGVRAFRNPVPEEEFPARLTIGILTEILEQLGEAAINASLLFPSGTPAPALPTDPSDGPSLLVPRHWGIYPL